MGALLAIAGFELKSRLRMLSTYVYFVLYLAITGLWFAAAGGAIPGATVVIGSERVFINSASSMAVGIFILGFLGVTVIASMMGRAIQQDFEHSSYAFFYTAPIRKWQYFFGRFLGAYLTLALIFTGIGIGILVGIHWPGVEAQRVGPLVLQALLRPYLFGMLPNMFWLGGIFFVIAALSRQMAPVYIAGVLVLLGYLLSLNLLGDMENKELAALVDPVGTTALSVLTRYWSVAEKNSQQLPLSGVLLQNREIWCAFGLLVIAIGYRLFRFEAIGTSSGKRGNAAAGVAPAVRSFIALPAARLQRGTAAWLRMLPAQTWMYVRESVRSPRFAAVVLGGILFVAGSASTMGDIFGTSTWPVTWQVLDFTSGLFSLFILVLTAIYAGELIWRERDVKVDEIIDATPQPIWLPFTSKFLALILIQGLLLVLALLCGIGIQLWYHYSRFELGHALFELFVLQWPGYWLIAVLALTVHVLVNQKYIGHFLVVLLFIIRTRLPAFGFEDKLYIYGARPEIIYSDINRYGHFLAAIGWFQIYWTAFAAMLLVVALAFWVRGRETSWKVRPRIARARVSVGSGVITALAMLVFVGSGAWIFHNTHQLNRFMSEYQKQALQADYEHRYKRFDMAPQPAIVGEDLDIAIHPVQHSVEMRGSYQLINRFETPIEDFYVMLPAGITEIKAINAGIPLSMADEATELGWRQYHLAQPLLPGGQTTFSFDIAYAVKGFRNDGADSTVLDNGTFMNAAIGSGTARLPAFGYDESAELESDRDRRKFGLPPKPRMHDLDDTQAQRLGLDWMTHYSATVSTDADQLPITSGTIDHDSIEHTPTGDRHVVHYEMDQPALAFVPFLSGRYAVKRDHWSNGKQEVDIEIDYQPGHEFDLDRMVDGVKDSLSYYTAHYSPYQFKLLRIIEFPRYQRFAESFPNTVPFSESIGFVARVDDKDPKDIDYPYWVTAHEVAHQWWGHQEAPGNVQGAAFVTESLAEYSSLMVLRHKYGEAKMHRFLHYELDRYLFGRSTESKKEQPLMRADGPAYLHYSKGSMALYALQDAIGEDKVNTALAAFDNEWKFKGPPYPTSRDLLAELRKVTPADRQFQIDDLFENITLFDNRATTATWKKTADGKYQVQFTVLAKKFHADGLGAETEVPMDQEVDIGVLDDKDQPLLLQKQRVHTGENHFTLLVDQQPAKAGIDPIEKLIDRTPRDNTVKVTAE